MKVTTKPTKCKSPAAVPGISLAFAVDPAMLPDLYQAIIRGKCLEPVFKDGVRLLVSRNDPYALGDFIVIHWRPDPHGQCPPSVKRMVMMPPPWVTFPWEPHPEDEAEPLFIVETLYPHEHLFLRCSALAIHKCRGLAPKGTLWRAWEAV